MRGILVAGLFAFLLSFFLTPLFIKFLARRGYGQQIRDDGPKTHHVKRGTPTMGGVVLVFAAIAGYFISHLITGSDFTTSAFLVIGLVLGLAAVGFLDDWLKVVKQRSLGLRAREKLLGQALVAAIFALLGLRYPDERGLSPISAHLSTVRDTSLALGTIAVAIWAIFLVLGSSNGVNLTDGLDGLASGAAVMSFLAFTLIGVWEFGQRCTVMLTSNCYEVRDPLDMAVLATSLAGACAGFLWWNASPARIFMGDTGSLALGGALAGLAMTLRTELLLIPIGGLFVIITMSVIIQTTYFKLSGGKRVFKMAPLQHHFELLGWGEVTIVIRFWIIAGLCVAAGLGLFYAQWVVA
ncbi:MAG: phospho-N-acetylmuramoyl-pentapeptide-transferase [Actinobacteria bacterium]|nr:phospho-N-acetylmuramoyl-pentapeptide-transferase [Actinomycetota bacterium]